MKELVVIFDGDCGFCQSIVNVLKKIDWLKKFKYIPFQEENVFNKYNQLTVEMCQKEMFLIKPTGEYYGGYDAFKIMSIYLPITFLVSWFFFLPGVTCIGRCVYKFIAENRHKIRVGKMVCKVDEDK